MDRTDADDSHGGTQQPAPQKAVRKVKGPLPAFPTITVILLFTCVLLHLVPDLAMNSNAGNVTYMIDGDTTDSDIRANRHAIMGANNDQLLADGQYWRLVTATFLHLGMPHVWINCMFLLFLGRRIEPVYGWGWFLGAYIVAGVVGNLLSWKCMGFPFIQAGASGSIFGLLGIGLVHYGRQMRQDVSAFFLKLLLGGIVFLVLGFVQEGADNLGHVGGLATGAILAVVMPAERVNQPRYRNAAIAVGVATAVTVLGCFVLATLKGLEYLEMFP